MTDIFWDTESSILVVAADRSLSSVLHRLDEENPDWVVVVRTLPEAPRSITTPIAVPSCDNWLKSLRNA